MGRVGRKEWRPSPDLFVHPMAGPDPLKSFDARVLGVPPLVIEVVSEDTWRYDVDAKRRAYGRVGVEEYLVFDPTREWLGEAARAWHATSRGFVRWSPGRDGRWHSRVLGIAFEPDGLLLRVVDTAGARLLHIGEQARQLREQAQRIAELEAENRRLRGMSE